MGPVPGRASEVAGEVGQQGETGKAVHPGCQNGWAWRESREQGKYVYLGTYLLLGCEFLLFTISKGNISINVFQNEKGKPDLLNKLSDQC